MPPSLRRAKPCLVLRWAALWAARRECRRSLGHSPSHGCRRALYFGMIATGNHGYLGFAARSTTPQRGGQGLFFCFSQFSTLDSHSRGKVLACRKRIIYFNNSAGIPRRCGCCITAYPPDPGWASGSRRRAAIWRGRPRHRARRRTGRPEACAAARLRCGPHCRR